MMEKENKVPAFMCLEKLDLPIIISTKTRTQEILNKWRQVFVELRAKLGGLDKKFDIGENKDVKSLDSEGTRPDLCDPEQEASP